MWLSSLEGTDGSQGEQGIQGIQGEQGENGSQGAQGLQGDAGSNGANGLSAYEIAVNNGYQFPEGVWLSSLEGTDGSQGEQGVQGDIGPQGTFFDGTQAGEMIYWNGSSWIAINTGQEDQNLTFCNGTPIWGPCPELASISTENGTNATENSIECGGLITNDGGADIIDKGLIWSSSSPNPTITENEGSLSSGSGSENFSNEILELQTSTTYYIRAYAQNSVGYSYGSVIEFTPQLPVQIGDFYQGGYVIYLNSNGTKFGPNGPESGTAGQHGIILRPMNLGNNPGVSEYWGCSTPNYTYSSYGYAQHNTNAIIDGCGEGNAPAVEMVNDYSVGGYSDWFLPTESELVLIYNFDDLLPQGAILSFLVYWSSTFCGASAQQPTLFRAFKKNFEESWSGASCDDINSGYRYLFAIRYF